MIPAYALVYLSQHVPGVLSRDAFEEGCEKSSFVEASFMISELADLALILAASFGSSSRLPSII